MQYNKSNLHTQKKNYKIKKVESMKNEIYVLYYFLHFYTKFELDKQRKLIKWIS
jgi:hypothetical protein